MKLGIELLYNVCKRLQETSSRNGKELIIEENKHYDDFKDLMLFLFNNNITTGIDIKKLNKEFNIDINRNDISVFYMLDELLKYIQVNNTGRDIDIASVKTSIYIISQRNTKYINFLNEVVTKSLRLGIDSATVNKVYGHEFIPTFHVQLGTSIENVKLSGDERIFISQKLNGTRCVYYNGKLWTRSGKQYTGCQHIIDDIENLISEYISNEIVLDGELVLKSCGLSDSEAFQKGTGIANSNNESKEELEYVIFDCISKDSFESKISTTKYSDRRKSLEEIISPAINRLELKNIRVVPFFYDGYNHEKIWECLDYAEKHDMEGIIVNLDTPYEFKRTKNLIKVKKFYDIDLRCISIEPGVKGKYKNTLGNIVCRYKDGEVRVGSGFTEEQRDYYWNHPGAIINEIVSVKYKEATKNKDGSESLQFPVFLCVREDKDIADE